MKTIHYTDVDLFGNEYEIEEVYNDEGELIEKTIA